MQTSSASQDLAERIRSLEQTRQRHMTALAEIDALLAQIADALASLPDGARTSAAAGDVTASASTSRARMRPHRRYRKLELTGEEAIVEFVRRRGRATTAEINANWRTEGRGGVANNAIVRLLKRGELTREPVAGSRGSYYRCRSAADRTQGSAAAGHRGVTVTINPVPPRIMPMPMPRMEHPLHATSDAPDQSSAAVSIA